MPDSRRSAADELFPDHLDSITNAARVKNVVVQPTEAQLRKMARASIQARWAFYLRRVLAGGNATKTAVARALEIPESRISEWLAEKRGVSTTSAMEYGDRLQDLLGLPTSGIEALFACAAFAEILSLFKYLACKGEETGDALAVQLFLWLPAHMLQYEAEWWDSQMLAANAAVPTIIPGILTRYGREWNALETEVKLSWRWKHPIPEVLTKAVRDPAARHLLLEAWGDLGRKRMRRSIALHQGLYRDSEELLDWVIELARCSRFTVPSLVAPRLWRLAAEWAYLTNPGVWEQYAAVLPHPYRTFEHRELTEEQRHYLDYLYEEAQRRRGK